MEVLIFVGIAAALVASFGVSAYAERLNRSSFAYFLLSLVATPIATLILLFGLGESNHRSSSLHSDSTLGKKVTYAILAIVAIIVMIFLITNAKKY